MFKLGSFLVTILFTLNLAWAKEHIAVKLKNSGMKTILDEVIENYSKADGNATITLPANTFYNVISKDRIDSNPVMSVIREFVKIDLNSDIDLYTKWEPIEIKALIDKDTVEFHTIGDGEDFKFVFKVEVTSLVIKGSRIEFCEALNEDETCKVKNGLYGRFDNFELRLKEGQSIHALIDTQTTFKGSSIELSFNEVISNLLVNKKTKSALTLKHFNIDKDKAPEFYMDFGDFHMPPPILHVNGRSIELDVSAIKNSILAERDFFANMLADFAGQFVADDLVSLVNEKVIKQLGDIQRVYKLIDYDRNKIEFEKTMQVLRDHGSKAMVEYMMGKKSKYEQEMTFVENFYSIVKSVVYKAEYDLMFSKIKTYNGKDVATFFDSVVKLNRKEIKLDEKVWNGQKTLGEVDFSKVTGEYDFGIAFSEPYLNSALHMAVKSRIVQRYLDSIVKLNGVNISNLNLHFKEPNKGEHLSRIIAVANVQVNLGQIDSDGYWDEFMNSLGSFIEGDFYWDYFIPRFRSGKIWFPLEMEFGIDLIKNDDDIEIVILGQSPFVDGKLRNSFNYPHKSMNSAVENALHKKLRKDIEPLIIKEHKINITKFVNAIPGLQLYPKRIHTLPSGHMFLTFDIEDINLKEFGNLLENEE